LPRILIITGQPQSLNGIHSELLKKGFACSIASPQDDVAEEVAEQAPDLVIMEMQGGHGPETAELLQKIKSDRQLAVLALIDRQLINTPDVNLEDIDDFVIGPGDTEELALRITRLLKKPGDTDPSELIKCDDLVIDLAKCEATLRGRRIELTFKEYELLRFLASHPGRVYTRDALLNRVWGYDYFGGDRTVDVHIRRLRSKIESLGHTFIDTVRNIGYRFNCNP
jgi:DNA-binding response OmpR family regulator